MFRQLLDIYSKKNGKADPGHIADLFIIRIQQHVETVRDLAQDSTTKIPDLLQWEGRAKIDLRHLKYQSRRDCDLSMHGWKRAKRETGKGSRCQKERELMLIWRSLPTDGRRSHHQTTHKTNTGRPLAPRWLPPSRPQEQMHKHRRDTHYQDRRQRLPTVREDREYRQSVLRESLVWPEKGWAPYVQKMAKLLRENTKVDFKLEQTVQEWQEIAAFSNDATNLSHTSHYLHPAQPTHIKLHV